MQSLATKPVNVDAGDSFPAGHGDFSSQPKSPTSNCLYCNGTGRVPIKEEKSNVTVFATCSACGGSRGIQAK